MELREKFHVARTVGNVMEKWILDGEKNEST